MCLCRAVGVPETPIILCAEVVIRLIPTSIFSPKREEIVSPRTPPVPGCSSARWVAVGSASTCAALHTLALSRHHLMDDGARSQARRQRYDMWHACDVPPVRRGGRKEHKKATSCMILACLRPPQHETVRYGLLLRRAYLRANSGCAAGTCPTDGRRGPLLRL